MRFLFSVVADRHGDVLATPDEIRAIDEFNDALKSSGRLELALGVSHPDNALTVDNRDGRGVVTASSPFDSTLFMSGFWIIHAEDVATAEVLAAGASRACNRLIEVREIL